MTPIPLLIAVVLPLPEPLPPPTPDGLDHFPPHHVCMDALRFNRACHARLWAARQQVDRWQRPEEYRWFSEALEAVDYRFQCWDWCAAASGPDYRGATFPPERVREQLLLLLGPEDYLAGCIPSPAPLWAFTER